MTDLLQEALRLIDNANSPDPNLVVVRGEERPLAQAHGQLACEWIERLVDAPSDALLIAARAHHLRRWELSRSGYPEGRAGYLRWREDQKSRHCVDVGEILGEVGFAPEVIERVQELIRTKGRGSDGEARSLEDATCLVFIETQLAELSTKLDRPHMIEVIRKTARKMSPAAIAAVKDLALDGQAESLLTEALS